MMLVITGVGFLLIHLYATSYMEGPRLLALLLYLNLFVFAMLILVLADNLPVLFIGWEGVGLCFLPHRLLVREPPERGRRQEGVHREPDRRLRDVRRNVHAVYYTGALDWTGIANGSSSLMTTQDSLRIHLWPIGGGEFRDWNTSARSFSRRTR